MINTFTIILISAGFFFFFATTVGIIRFPGFYARMHAAGKGDTISPVLMLLGLAIYNLHHFSWASVLVSIKIMLISVFIFLASPTATHAIMDAGYEAKVKHWTRRNTEDGSYTGPERRKKEERHD